MALATRHMKTKQAFNELAGTGDSGFEQAFANLAQAFLKDAAPGLLDHQLGFQLLDKNQDDTRAVGVFAFMVGSQILYAPVFFLNGDLKGNELLYIKNQDIFVPLSEGWLQYIINRKPNVLGEGVDSNTANLGVRNPDLSELSEPPSKMAADLSDFVSAFLPKYASLQLADFSKEWAHLKNIFSTTLSLDNRLKKASVAELQTVCDLIEQDSIIAEGFQRWHGFAKLAAAVKAAEERALKASVLDEPDLPQASVLFTPSNLDVYLDVDMLPGDVTEPELEYFYSHSILVRDSRPTEEKAEVVDENNDIRLGGPTVTGKCLVLDKSGRTVEKIVLMRPVGRHGFTRSVNLLSVSGNELETFKPDQLFVADNNTNPREEFKKWWAGKGNGSPTKGSTIIAVTEDGMSSMPFRVERSLGKSSDGSSAYAIFFNSSCCNSDQLDMDTSSKSRFTDGSGEQRLYVGSKADSKIHASNNDIFVPASAKFITVDTYPGESFAPGDVHDAQRRLQRGTIKVKATREGERYAIDGQKMASKQAALKALLVKYKMPLDKGDAALAKLANAAPKASHSFRLKLAYPSLLDNATQSFNIDMNPGQTSPDLMAFGGEMAPQATTRQEISELSSANSDLSGYSILDEGRNAIHAYVQQASVRGDKDVFDAGMLATMLKTVKEDLIIDDHIPELMKAVDRLGRLIFMFYWHYDKFSGRFGKQAMPELEDTLRNSFEMLSDVILFLKNKTIEPYDEDDMPGVSLTDSQE